MNGTVLRALFIDAYQQVLDNWVFRILAALVFGTVAFSFAVGASPDYISILWLRYPYAELGFEANMLPGEARREILQGLQTLFIDNVVGTFGLLGCLAATSFFVPQMLERGAADTLFSKPVSRIALLTARYAAGLLFVGLLAVALVGGLFLGLKARWGLEGTDLLWSAPVLVYRYAIVYSATVLIGVLTRSSVAALLGSFLFLGFNGCVHGAWEVREFTVNARSQMEASARASETKAKETRTKQNEQPAPEAAAQPEAEAGVVAPQPEPDPVEEVEAPAEAADTEPESPPDEGFSLVRGLWKAVTVAHFVLPKPGEAPRIVELLTDGDPDAADARKRAEFDAKNAERVAKGLRPRSPPKPPPGDFRLRWGGPWPRNAYVSIATSLGFALAVFLAAAWRLSRIRF